MRVMSPSIVKGVAGVKISRIIKESACHLSHPVFVGFNRHFGMDGNLSC